MSGPAGGVPVAGDLEEAERVARRRAAAANGPAEENGALVAVLAEYVRRGAVIERFGAELEKWAARNGELVDDRLALSELLRGMARRAGRLRREIGAWAETAVLADGKAFADALGPQASAAMLQVARVRALHCLDEEMSAATGRDCCKGCATSVTHSRWPCKTIAALDGQGARHA